MPTVPPLTTVPLPPRLPLFQMVAPLMVSLAAPPTNPLRVRALMIESCVVSVSDSEPETDRPAPSESTPRIVFEPATVIAPAVDKPHAWSAAAGAGPGFQLLAVSHAPSPAVPVQVTVQVGAAA